MKKKKRTKITPIKRARKGLIFLVLNCQIYLKYFVMESSSSRRVLIRMNREIFLKWKENGSMECLMGYALLIVTRQEEWSHLHKESSMEVHSGQSTSKVEQGFLLNTTTMGRQVDFRERTKMRVLNRESMASLNKLILLDGSSTSSNHLIKDSNSNQRL